MKVPSPARRSASQSKRLLEATPNSTASASSRSSRCAPISDACISCKLKKSLLFRRLYTLVLFVSGVVPLVVIVCRLFLVLFSIINLAEAGSVLVDRDGLLDRRVQFYCEELQLLDL